MKRGRQALQSPSKQGSITYKYIFGSPSSASADYRYCFVPGCHHNSTGLIEPHRHSIAGNGHHFSSSPNLFWASQHRDFLKMQEGFGTVECAQSGLAAPEIAGDYLCVFMNDNIGAHSLTDTTRCTPSQLFFLPRLFVTFMAIFMHPCAFTISATFHGISDKYVHPGGQFFTQ